MSKLKQIYTELEQQAYDMGFESYDECEHFGYTPVYDNDNPHWTESKQLENEIERAREQWEYDKLKLKYKKGE